MLFLPSAPCFDHDQSEINQVLPPEKGWQEVSLSLEGGFCVSDSHALIRHCPSTVKLALTLENVTNSGRYSGWAGLDTGQKLIDLASLGIVRTGTIEIALGQSLGPRGADRPRAQIHLATPEAFRQTVILSNFRKS